MEFKDTELLALRDRHEAWLMAQPGVIGTGIGLGQDGQVVLRIFTKGIQKSTQQDIRTRLADVPVEWEDGEVVAY